MRVFWNELYQSALDNRLNDYVLKHWDEALVLIGSDPEEMGRIIEVANQCILVDQKEIYDDYIRNLLIGKGVTY